MAWLRLILYAWVGGLDKRFQEMFKNKNSIIKLKLLYFNDVFKEKIFMVMIDVLCKLSQKIKSPQILV